MRRVRECRRHVRTRTRWVGGRPRSCLVMLAPTVTRRLVFQTGRVARWTEPETCSALSTRALDCTHVSLVCCSHLEAPSAVSFHPRDGKRAMCLVVECETRRPPLFSYFLPSLDAYFTFRPVFSCTRHFVVASARRMPYFKGCKSNSLGVCMPTNSAGSGTGSCRSNEARNHSLSSSATDARRNDRQEKSRADP